MKSQKGITLVSLVVTIIILIILAGISINTLLGENGIITRAKQAKENMTLAQQEEQQQLNQLYTQWELGGDIGNNSGNEGEAIEKLTNFKSVIATAITNQGISTSVDDTAETMAENIGMILQERTKEATATQEDIAEGKTAWVNGELITGISSGTELVMIHGEAGSNTKVSHTIPAGGKKGILVTGIAGLYSSIPGTLNSSANISNITIKYQSTSGKENYYGSGFRVTTFDIDTNDEIIVSVTYANYSSSGKNWYTFIRY